jgi:nitrous oxide reductase
MPQQDPQQEADRRLSRRSMLRGAAAAGAAGLAVTAIGAGATAAQAATTQSGSGRPEESKPATAAGPLVVHVRDAKTGDIEVFHGTSATRLRDKDLAARIAAAIK